MSDALREMDSWTSEEVARFKDEGRAPYEVALETLEAGGPPALVAEGDSWFDYLPGTDVIDCLRRRHGYRIGNYANAGDTLENMIYGTGINKRFERTAPTIGTVLRRLGQLKPKVFLFSGGGNDVAGEEFESYLNHRDSGLPVLREDFLDRMVNVVFRKYYEDLIAKVAAVSPETYVVTHGYGHTVPTGEGVDILFFRFAGPWLRPALARKGVLDPIEQRHTVVRVINTFNLMLSSLAANHPKFCYVDLRDMIDPDRDWVNELHLYNSAYARVAARIDQAIQALP
ncbi:MAG TPA: hypothetical protein VNE39_19070 [Planctomycetota bacterium]|nr:hypothetical protein [Planctomycetota bacterium]